MYYEDLDKKKYCQIKKKYIELCGEDLKDKTDALESYRENIRCKFEEVSTHEKKPSEKLIKYISVKNAEEVKCKDDFQMIEKNKSDISKITFDEIKEYIERKISTIDELYNEFYRNTTDEILNLEIWNKKWFLKNIERGTDLVSLEAMYEAYLVAFTKVMNESEKESKEKLEYYYKYSKYACILLKNELEQIQVEENEFENTYDFGSMLENAFRDSRGKGRNVFDKKENGPRTYIL